jgi:hypothetical protein
LAIEGPLLANRRVCVVSHRPLLVSIDLIARVSAAHPKMQKGPMTTQPLIIAQWALGIFLEHAKSPSCRCRGEFPRAQLRLQRPKTRASGPACAKRPATPRRVSSNPASNPAQAILAGPPGGRPWAPGLGDRANCTALAMGFSKLPRGSRTEWPGPAAGAGPQARGSSALSKRHWVVFTDQIDPRHSKPAGRPGPNIDAVAKPNIGR